MSLERPRLQKLAADLVAKLQSDRTMEPLLAGNPFVREDILEAMLDEARRRGWKETPP